MTNGESLESLISRAGGLKRERENKELEPRYLRLDKKNKNQYGAALADYFKSGYLPKGFKISAGDTLVFQVDSPRGENLATSGTTVQIMGEVMRAGDLAYKSGADIYYYLHAAGGPGSGANLNEIKLVRGPESKRVIASLDTLEEGKLPIIKPGDIIVVPHDKPTKTERTFTMGANLATIISALILLIVIL